MRFLLAALSVSIAVAACGGGATPAATASKGAPPPPPKSLDEQIAAGGSTFQSVCASCHGENGEGGDKAPRLIGPKGLDAYKSAQETFTYIKEHMPPDAPGSLHEQDYWNVTAFLVKKNDLPVTDILSPETAAAVKWSR